VEIDDDLDECSILPEGNLGDKRLRFEDEVALRRWASYDVIRA
jgi:hypothetical protein